MTKHSTRIALKTPVRRRKVSTNDEFALTVPECARYLRCGPRSVYQLIKEGQCPSLNIGRKIIVPRAAFFKWLESIGQKTA